jgi:Tol biopolymer transport system component
MKARYKVGWLGWAVAGVSAAMVAGGCTRLHSAWDALTARESGDPIESTAPETPEPVAQGEDDPAPEAPTATATANGKASIPDVSPAATAEPVKIPVVNIFGELDGRQQNARVEPGDFGFQQHTFSDEGYDADVNVDRTGKWMVFASTRHSERSEIYLQRVDGTSVTQLTSDPSENAQPCFSPDGKSIAFCSTRAGSWDLYTMDTDGRNVTQITSGPTQDMHPSFSPDGSRLVYSSIGSRSGQWEIWVVTLATRERMMVGTGLFPSWSPDKSVERIAFQRARQRGSRWFSLWTLDLSEGEARRITEVAVSSNAAIISPCWSPDGKRLAFATVVDPAQTNKGKPRGQQDVWIIDADGGARRRLTDGTSTCLSPFWASDGRVYFISDRGGRENVWSVRTEPSNVWPVASKGATHGPGEGASPKTAIGSTSSELEK